MNSMDEATALRHGLVQYANRAICRQGGACNNVGTAHRCKYRHLRAHLKPDQGVQWFAEVFAAHPCPFGKECKRYQNATCGFTHAWSDYLTLPMEAGVTARAWLEVRNPAAAFLTDAYQPVAEQQARDAKAAKAATARRRLSQKQKKALRPQEVAG